MSLYYLDGRLLAPGTVLDEEQMARVIIKEENIMPSEDRGICLREQCWKDRDEIKRLRKVIRDDRAKKPRRALDDLEESMKELADRIDALESYREQLLASQGIRISNGSRDRGKNL